MVMSSSVTPASDTFPGEIPLGTTKVILLILLVLFGSATVELTAVMFLCGNRDASELVLAMIHEVWLPSCGFTTVTFLSLVL